MLNNFPGFVSLCHFELMCLSYTQEIFTKHLPFCTEYRVCKGDSPPPPTAMWLYSWVLIILNPWWEQRAETIEVWRAWSHFSETGLSSYWEIPLSGQIKTALGDNFCVLISIVFFLVPYSVQIPALSEKDPVCHRGCTSLCSFQLPPACTQHTPLELCSPSG